ncbi:hypothetical protein ACHAW5_003319 [Stephanodiscus triporus]|uniref:RING-type domain-containing protein n=1 Tax=Stephanodiscus triporus TaxID=2934178 RepID=A0ABD3QB29_9STRA
MAFASGAVAGVARENAQSLSCQRGHADGHIANASYAARAATVSPFADRMPLRTTGGDDGIVEPLEPVPEERAYENSDLSQSTNASCPTFEGDDAASDSACEVDSGLAGYGNETGSDAMVGTTVACRTGCGPSLAFAANNYELGFCMLLEDCPPPTKRARLDDCAHRSFQSNDDDDIMLGDSPSPPLGVETDETSYGHFTANKKTSADCANLRTNVDRYDGMACCHVCSVEAPRRGNSSHAITVGPLFDARHRGGHVGAETLGPRSHSLFAYFQPTKRPASHPHKAQAPNLSTSSSHDVKSSNSINESNLSPCRYCDKPTCISCTRRCEMCQHRFCIFCTKVNYESSVVECVFCFECDEHCRNAGCVSGVGGARGAGRDNADCDMMDLWT